MRWSILIALLGFLLQAPLVAPAINHFGDAQHCEEMVNTIVVKVFFELWATYQVDLNSTMFGKPSHGLHPTRVNLMVPSSFVRHLPSFVPKSLALRPSIHEQTFHNEAPRMSACGSLHRRCNLVFTTTGETTKNSADSSKANAAENAGWEELGVSSRLATAMQAQMGILRPNELQIKSIPTILEGRDAMLCSHPGSGKTLAGLVPFVQQLLRDGLITESKKFNAANVTEFRPKVLILIPYRELALQASRVLFDLLSEFPQFLPTNAKDFMDFQHPDIAVCTTYDLMQRIKNTVNKRASLKRKGINLDKLRSMMIDEADLLVKKEDTRPPKWADEEKKPKEAIEYLSADFKRILRHAGMPLDQLTLDQKLRGAGKGKGKRFRRNYEVQFVILSAEAQVDPAKERILQKLLSNLAVFNSSVFEDKDADIALSPTLRHAILEIKQGDGKWYLKPDEHIKDKEILRNYQNVLYLDKLKLLPCLLTTSGPGQDVIVFINKKRSRQTRLLGGPRQLLLDLIQAGFTAEMLDASNLIQNNNQSSRVFVAAADEAARGIDTKSVSRVINFDVPPSKGNYVQRAGRAGRAGQAGTVITMVATAEEDLSLKEELLGQIGITDIHDCQVLSAFEDNTDIRNPSAPGFQLVSEATVTPAAMPSISERNQSPTGKTERESKDALEAYQEDKWASWKNQFLEDKVDTEVEDTGRIVYSMDNTVDSTGGDYEALEDGQEANRLMKEMEKANEEVEYTSGVVHSMDEKADSTDDYYDELKDGEEESKLLKKMEVRQRKADLDNQKTPL